MEYVIICFVALLGSTLTLFSGFGLGTLLLPVFGLFFPIEIAVAMTAVVHFFNNLFKLILLGKKANVTIVLKFGIPALLFAFIGAYTLNYLSETSPLYTYTINHRTVEITLLKVSIGFLLIIFAAFDFIPKLKNLEFKSDYLPIGGMFSGFFGGLSGHQGALRSAFLVRSGLTKEVFIATGVVIACLIDISRISVYGTKIIYHELSLNYVLIFFTTFSAFIGVYFGNKLLAKTTFKFIQKIVAALLLIYGLLLISGII